MNLKELKEALNGFDDEMEVFMVVMNEEGNDVESSAETVYEVNGFLVIGSY